MAIVALLSAQTLFNVSTASADTIPADRPDLSGDAPRSIHDSSSTTQPSVTMQAEFDNVLERVSELEFDAWCSFNGFEGLPTTSRLHNYPCLRKGKYTAIRKGNRTELYKRHEGRMLRIEPSAGNKGSEYAFRADLVREAFGIEGD